MNKVKVAKSGGKVGLYVAIGMGVEVFVKAVIPQMDVPDGAITLGVSTALASIVNYLKHKT